jgi:hypothetical protein
MDNISRSSILESLEELSDRSAQRRLWLSPGDGDVSSFTEAVEMLFTDTGLGDALDQRRTGLGGEAEEAPLQLERALRDVDRSLPPGLLIESAEMGRVRELAAFALTKLEAGPEGSKRT